jgi:Tfp pilus assembly protein PilN
MEEESKENANAGGGDVDEKLIVVALGAMKKDLNKIEKGVDQTLQESAVAAKKAEEERRQASIIGNLAREVADKES